jgi:hypothetical protein
LDQSDAADTRQLPLLALGAAALLLAVAALAGRDLWFFSDDWNIYADYHAGGLLEPFNGHLSLVPAGIYLVLFHTVGMDSYLPYRLSGLVALAVLAFQLVRFAHTRLGERGPESGPASFVARGAVLVALAVAAVLWNSAGTMNLLFPFLMNFTLPIAALVAIWWHLDRADGDDAEHAVRHEVLASLWLCLALGTSGLGLMTLAAVGVELVASRAPWRRLAVMAPGPVLWAVWYLGHRDANQMSTDVAAVLEYCARMFLGATTSLAAGSDVLGVLLAVLTVGFFVLAAWRWRSLDARTLGALAAPATFILFTAVTRLDIVPAIPPDELRYSWAVAAYLVLAAVVAARRTPMFDVTVPSGAWIAAAAVALVVLGLGAVRLWDSMQDWNRQVAEARPGLSTVLFATEAIGADRIDPDVVIPLSYVPVTTGGYLSAAADVGSPIAEATAADLGGAAYNRQVADQLLVEQLGIRLEASGIDGCRGAQPLTPDADGSYSLQPGQRVFVADASGAGSPLVRLSRFAPLEDAIELGPGGETFDLALPSDDPSVARLPGLDRLWPYRVTVDGGFALSVLLCEEASAE